jgi:hypothetical protein
LIEIRLRQELGIVTYPSPRQLRSECTQMVLRTLQQTFENLPSLLIGRLRQHSPQVADIHLLDFSSHQQSIQRATRPTGNQRSVKLLVLGKDEHAWSVVHSNGIRASRSNQTLDRPHVLTFSAGNVPEDGQLGCLCQTRVHVARQLFFFAQPQQIGSVCMGRGHAGRLPNLIPQLCSRPLIAALKSQSLTLLTGAGLDSRATCPAALSTAVASSLLRDRVCCNRRQYQ